MFGLNNFGRRLVESVVGLFAILGFVYVPLGHHTGFEHVKAVLSTPAAASAIDDLSATAIGLRKRALDFVTARMNPSVGATAGDGPSPEPAPKPRAHGREPRPVPPKLK